MEERTEERSGALPRGCGAAAAERNKCGRGSASVRERLAARNSPSVKRRVGFGLGEETGRGTSGPAPRLAPQRDGSGVGGCGVGVREVGVGFCPFFF